MSATTTNSNGNGMVVEAKDVTKVYQMGRVEVRALDGVSLVIKQSEFVAIMGPSGSGKSTLLNLIGCLDRPTTGELHIAGTDIAKLSDRKLAQIRGKQIGFVFQTFNLIPRISALQNVLLPMSFVNTFSPSERVKRAQQILDTVGLGQRMKHFPNELSGGERQRVAIARALANNPSVILADEPTGNLDTKTGRSILELFKSLNQQGRTIVLVTHDPNVAANADRIVHVMDGRIQDETFNHAVTVARS
ncbi:ABC transporter ATP-binding protein [Candidatus Acetothermia bacterium]|nr:ABC transporter ATP-binding protein [Candidatus Acetothermia bacterium]